MAMGGPTVMPIDGVALHRLTAWLSPSYPVGAFAYSHGLETAIVAGDVDSTDSLFDWLYAILWHGTGRNDAILLTLAYRCDQIEDIRDLSDLASALSPSAERHLETTAQGAAFGKVTSHLRGGDLSGLAYPVAIGVAARADDIPLAPTVAMYLHAFAANLVAAAVRFVPLGQSDGQAVLDRLFDTFDAVADHAMTQTVDGLGGAAFQADLHAMQHETQTIRIFRS